MTNSVGTAAVSTTSGGASACLSARFGLQHSNATLDFDTYVNAGDGLSAAILAKLRDLELKALPSPE